MLRPLLTATFVFLSSFAFSQEQPAKPDLSGVTVLQSSTTVRFENDGSSLKTGAFKYRANNEAGLRQMGLLQLGYQGANETLEIRKLQIRKLDGTLRSIPSQAIQDEPQEITRQAPQYTDLRLRHIAIPNLAIGDILEYEIEVRSKAIVPNRFWFSYSFMRDLIVLDEQLTLDVPAERNVKLRYTKGLDPVMEQANGRKIYRWKWRHPTLEPEPSEDEKLESAERQAAGELKPGKAPDVQITTFKDWDEFSAWYSSVIEPQIQVTPEIKNKALDLTANAKTDDERFAAIYRFVAQQYRYISISFGIGRLQPHLSSEVFQNHYGDCKDKHTLLASMLQAVGIHALPVLANSTRAVERDMPSPDEFDHVFTAIETASGLRFADSTTEVASPGHLIPVLRGVDVLLIQGKSGKLVQTPKDIPFKTVRILRADGKVTAAGKVTAKMQQEAHGDVELVLRMAFRNTPEAKWKDLVQAISYVTGFSGQVSNIAIEDPGAIEKPFAMRYDYSRDDYITWSGKTGSMKIALPDMSLPRHDQKSSAKPRPVFLGTKAEIIEKSRMEFPPGTRAQVPIAMRLDRPFATYTSAYSLEGNTLVTERRLEVKEGTIPAEREAEYISFSKAVFADQNQNLTLFRDSTEVVMAGLSADDLNSAGNDALEKNDYKEAERLLKRAVELDPNHKLAWNNLGRAQLKLGRAKEAETAIRKQIELNEYDEYAYTNLGLALRDQKRNEEAEKAFRKQLEINPLDPWANANLGSLLFNQKRYEEAVKALEAAITANPDSKESVGLLVMAYQETKQTEKQKELMQRYGYGSPENRKAVDIFANLSDSEKENMERELRNTVELLEGKLKALQLQNISNDDLATVNGIYIAWAKMGRLLFEKRKYEEAEPFLRAAWIDSSSPFTGGMLAEIYEMQGKKTQATELFAQTLAMHHDADQMEHLVKLVGSAKADTLINGSRQKSQEMRTIRLKAPPAKGSAEFLILLSADSKVVDAALVSGDHKLERMKDILKTVRMPASFPPASSARIVRRGVLSCYGSCMFVLFDSSAFQSVN